MIVIDASAALSGLLNDGAARVWMTREQLHAPHLIDSEVVSVLRHHVASGRLPVAEGWGALAIWRRLGLTRYPSTGLLDRIWQLRENVTPYDAGYVALAESLRCQLLTADSRLSRAPGIECPITFVPR
ncbi:PIN domain-containing protein [soil metagenome]